MNIRQDIARRSAPTCRHRCAREAAHAGAAVHFANVWATADVLPKPTPYNLRRFAETPIARKAINTVKDRVAGMRWRVQPKMPARSTSCPMLRTASAS